MSSREISSKPSGNAPAAAAAGRRRVIGLAGCGVLVAAMLAAAFTVPLPSTVLVPGLTANTLGTKKGEAIIEVSGAPVRRTEGALRLVTVGATLPNTKVTLVDAVRTWFDSSRQVVPRSSVYPEGRSDQELEKLMDKQMSDSQQDAVGAALNQLGDKGEGVTVKLHLAEVGGPSAGLLFALGIVDKVEGNGRGGDLTGGRNIAGTGAINKHGKVGQVGGIELKVRAARRDGATVFLVPKAECGVAENNRPKGLRLIPVSTLQGAIDALIALDGGKGKGRVPSCS